MSNQILETVKAPPLLPNKPPGPLPRVWPHLTMLQRQHLAQQLAYLIRRYRQVAPKEDNHDHP